MVGTIVVAGSASRAWASTSGGSSSSILTLTVGVRRGGGVVCTTTSTSASARGTVVGRHVGSAVSGRSVSRRPVPRRSASTSRVDALLSGQLVLYHGVCDWVGCQVLASFGHRGDAFLSVPVNQGIYFGE